MYQEYRGVAELSHSRLLRNTHGKSLFQLDEKLIKRIIEMSCSEADGEAAINNGVITDDVAGSRRWNQPLTSG